MSRVDSQALKSRGDRPRAAFDTLGVTMFSARRHLSLVAGLAAALAASSLVGITAQAAVSAMEPPWSSAQRIGGAGSDDGNAVTSTGNGRAIVTGNFSGTAYFPRSATPDDSIALTTNDDSQDIFIAGMDSTGQYVEWAQRAGGPGSSFSYDVAVMGTKTVSGTDDTVIVTGPFDGTMYFPKSASNADDSFALTSTGSKDTFVAALAPGSHYFAWALQAGPNTASDVAYGNSVVVSNDDTPIVVGFFTGTLTFPTGGAPLTLTAGGSDMYLAALRPDGSGFAWAQGVGGSGGVIGDDIALMGSSTVSAVDDTVVVLGTMTGVTYFPTGRAAPDDSIAVSPRGTQDVFVAAMNADDTYFAWAQGVGGGVTTPTYSGSIAVLGDDTPIIVGNFGETAYFPTGRPSPDDSIALTASTGTQDIFVAAMQPRTPFFAWAQKAGGAGEDWGLGISISADDTTIITGYFTGTAAFPASGTTISLAAIPGATDTYVATLPPGATTFAWAQMAGGSASDALIGLDVAAVGDDTAVVVGNLTGTATFPQTVGAISLQSRGSKDAFTGVIAAPVQGGVTPTPDPTPDPVYPASAPTGVTATAGDASARVSWSAPASTGSFPVTSYQATSTPGGQSCLVTAPALTCDVEGLTNGTTYTFTVRALNGAGWSAESARSNAVIPQSVDPPPVEKSITITGSRSGTRIVIGGSSTGIGTGAILKPWVRLAGQTAYAQGTAQVLVSMVGTFEWGRKTGKRTSVYMQTPDGSVRSNTITIR